MTTPHTSPDLMVRFVVSPDRVVVETLSTVDHAGGDVLAVVEDETEAYRLVRVNGWNLRYVQTAGPASPLVVLR